MKHLTTFLLLGAMTLAACAPGPDAIAPVSMTGTYDRASCASAMAALTAERATLAALSEQQRNAQTGDAIGVFLLAVPVSSLTGGDKTGLIAVSKGKVLALEARLASC